MHEGLYQKPLRNQARPCPPEILAGQVCVGGPVWWEAAESRTNAWLGNHDYMGLGFHTYPGVRACVRRQCAPIVYMGCRWGSQVYSYLDHLLHLFYLRPADIYIGLSVRPYVRLFGIFDHLPVIRISRNLQGICTLDRVISGHRSQGCRIKVKVTAGDKLVIFSRFFILLRTRPTV